MANVTCPICGAPLDWASLAPLRIHHIAAIGLQPRTEKDTLMPRRWCYCPRCKKAFIFIKDSDSWSPVNLLLRSAVDMFVLDKQCGIHHE